MSREEPPDFGQQVVDTGGGAALWLFSVAVGLALFVLLVTR